MNRRNFLQLGSLAGLASLLDLSIVLDSCAKAQMPTFNGKVIIVGGGAAGMYAAYLLSHYKIDFVVLEASERLGGRLGKNDTFADFTIDTGAQWLHGRNNILNDYINAQQLKLTKDESELVYWYKGQLIKQLPKDPFIFEEKNLPDCSFSDYAQQQGLDSNYQFIIEAIAGDQGADANDLSAYYNHYDERNWSSGDDDYKFEASYFEVFDQIRAQLNDHVLLQNPVSSIDYSQSKIQVTCSNGQTHEADKVIVTVPLTQLQKKTIAFFPELPSSKQIAIDKLGMGPGLKVFLKFSESFYHQNIYGGSVCAAYIDEKVGKSGQDHLLMAFIMGNQAEVLKELSDSQITNALLNELELMYPGKAQSLFIDSFVINWAKQPFIEGAYSYSRIGQGEARMALAEPVADKLYFAGEASNTNGHHQTVFGAVETAYRDVLKLLQLS